MVYFLELNTDTVFQVSSTLIHFGLLCLVGIWVVAPASHVFIWARLLGKLSPFAPQRVTLNGEPYGLVRGDFVLHNRRQNFAERNCIFSLKSIWHYSQPAFFKSNIVSKARIGGIGLQVYFWKFCVCEKSWNSKS